MNTRFLESFVWVARLRSFKAAADRLYTTQAGISSRIATLEEQFGVKLFERDSRSVELTPQGMQLMPHAERMLALQATMLATVGRHESLMGVLRIGVIETVVYTWLAELLAGFAAKHPNITLELESADTPTLHEHLLRGALDCIISADDVVTGFVENRRIATMTMVWASRPDLRSKLPAGPCTFADLTAHPIISFQRISPVYRDISQGTLTSSPVRISHFSSLGAMTGLVRSGFGVALLPRAVVADDIARGLLEVIEVTPPPTPLPLVGSQRAEQASPLADAVLAMAQQVSDLYVAAHPELRAD